MEDGHWHFELSKDLETLGPFNYDGRLRTGMTAHPKLCPETGELLFFAYGMEPPYLTYHRADKAGNLVQSEVFEVIEGKGATMMHDFNITRNQVIFMILPLLWNLESLAVNGLPIQWSDSYGARLGVMPRDDSNADVIWCDIDPCYVYHPLNPYEFEDSIIIDTCRMAHSMKPGVADVPPVLHRWTIDLNRGRVSDTQPDDIAVDFPRVPDARVRLPYRYTAQFGHGLPTTVAFRKYDLQTGQCDVHELSDGRQGGEPVFVPAIGASSEDDGYLLSLVYDPATDKSEQVILDASRLSSAPIARIHLPVRSPAGFHGSWIAD